MAIRAFAPAKINLALHITGRRADGYHLLDSLVAFADCGDWITAEPAETLSLTITGPQAGTLSATDNLVLRAAHAIDPQGKARITLEKNLPIASGIGGGSADAAATLHALSQLWGKPLPPPETVLALGADIPVCLNAKAARMQGVGEIITQTPLQPVPALLVNPKVALATAAVFRALQSRDNPPLQGTPSSQADWLTAQRNDLEAPAIQIEPAITQTLQALRALPGCTLARMSGSGATCFALFATQTEAQTAAQTLRQAQPGWWITPTTLG